MREVLAGVSKSAEVLEHCSYKGIITPRGSISRCSGSDKKHQVYCFLLLVAVVVCGGLWWFVVVFSGLW